MKRQPRDRQKISANDVTNNSFLSKIQKQLIKLNNKQANQKIKNLNIHLSKGDIQMANRYMKRCLTLLIVREIQLRTTMRYHLTSVRMAVIKKSTNNKCWRGCGEKGTLLHCVHTHTHTHRVGGSVNWCSHFGKQYGDFSNN